MSAQNTGKQAAARAALEFVVEGKVLGVGEGLMPKETYLKQGVIWDERARTYWAHMGYSNQVGLLKFALTQAGVTGLSLPKPQPRQLAPSQKQEANPSRLIWNDCSQKTWAPAVDSTTSQALLPGPPKKKSRDGSSAQVGLPTWHVLMQFPSCRLFGPQPEHESSLKS